MKHVSILSLHGATITSIDSSHQILSRINDFLKYQGKTPFYEVDIIGVQKNIELNSGLYTIRADKTIDEISKTDVIIIPLLCGDFSKALVNNRNYWRLGSNTISKRCGDSVSLCRIIFPGHNRIT